MQPEMPKHLVLLILVMNMIKALLIPLQEQLQIMAYIEEVFSVRQ